MQLKLTLNIGAADQQQLGLDKTQEGEIVNVDQKTGAVLLANGWGVDPAADKDTSPGGLRKAFDAATPADLKSGTVQASGPADPETGTGTRGAEITQERKGDFKKRP